MEKSIITKWIENFRRDNEKITQTLIEMYGTDLEHNADNFKYLAAVRSDVNSALDSLKLRKIQGKYSVTVIDVNKGV